MVKKLVTIDVNDKELTVSKNPAKAKEVKISETTEMEKLGFVEINNTQAAKKSKSSVVKGFEKNVCEGSKRGVKAQTSLVEDYFDFSFRKNEKAKETAEEVVEKKVVKTATKKTTAKTTKAVAEKKTTAKKSVKKEEMTAININDSLKLNQNVIVENTVNFDNEVNNIIRVARIGSLFDCDKRIIEA